MKFPVDLFAIGVCLSFVALFAGVIVWMARAERKRARVKVEQAVQLGFTAIPKPEQALVNRIYALYALRGRRLSLRHLFYRRCADYDLYLFDLWDTSGEDSSHLVENGAAVVSPHLSLPRLMLFSRIEGDGFMANAANKLIERFITGQNKIELFNEPDFNAHFWACGPDADAARAFLTHDLLDRIGTLKNVQVQMGGDTFTLSSNTPNTGQQAVEALQAINQNLRDAQSLEGWLMR